MLGTLNVITLDR